MPLLLLLLLLPFLQLFLVRLPTVARHHTNITTTTTTTTTTPAFAIAIANTPDVVIPTRTILDILLPILVLKLQQQL